MATTSTLDPLPSRAVAPRVRAEPSSLAGWILPWVLAHAALGVLAHAFPPVVTLHAWVAALTALAFALFARALAPAVVAGAYVVGADVFWRAGEARFFYEGPKYVLAVVCGVCLLRHVRAVRRGSAAIVYLIALAPGAALGFLELGPGRAREALSFNLSGPLALGAAVVLFSHLRVSWRELRNILVATIGPLASMAGLALAGIVTAESIEFGTESNKAASAGFGPNQVSVALGFGALACLVLVLRDQSRVVKLTATATAAWFFAHTLLTFSRGGVINVILSAGLLLLFELQVPRRRLRAMLALTLGVGLALMAFARVDSFTEGALDTRYSNVSSTGRSDIAQDDLRLFRDHLPFGVGAGNAQYSRMGFPEAGASAHTEFTRLLGEHGLLGVVAMAALLVMGLSAVTRAAGRHQRTLVVAFAVFALASMTHAAMRLSLVSLSFGLAILTARSRDVPTDAVPARAGGARRYEHRPSVP